RWRNARIPVPLAGKAGGEGYQSGRVLGVWTRSMLYSTPGPSDGTARDRFVRPRSVAPPRPVPAAMEVRDRGLAGLAVRRIGHASLRARRDPVRCRAAPGRSEGLASQADQLVGPGRLPDRLGPRGRLLRPHRRPPGPQPGPHADHPDLRRVHRAVVLRPDL